MAKLIYLLFTLLFIASVALAEEETCSPWLGYCSVRGDCCRYLTCLGYNRRCVPIYGIKDPYDQRPIGPGPFPPEQF